MNTISLGDPVFGEPEKQALLDVMDSGWITMGGRVKAFEKAFAKAHDTEYAVAVNSCSAGLHLGLVALGIAPGDEVLVPSLTFVATVNAILYVGATPVFVDILSTEQPHISLEHAEACCTNKTRAAIVMHYGGYPVDMKAWRKFADKQRLYLIEDAAHAPGAASVGKLGDISVFSFFANKNMTTGEGGMVLANDPDLVQKLRSLRTHGMTTTTLDRYKGHAYTYDVSMLGYNYRLDEMRAAIGLVQLERLSIWNDKRRRLDGVYRELLAEYCSEVGVPFTAESESVSHLLPILLPDRVDRGVLMEKLRSDGIQSSIHYPPVHHFSFYKERFPDVTLPITEAYCASELTLPMHPSMDFSDVERIVYSLAASI